jgi:hypothetical protein
VIPFFLSDYYPELFAHLNSSSLLDFEGHFTYNQNTRKQFYCHAREKDQFAPGWFSFAKYAKEENLRAEFRRVYSPNRYAE